MSAAGLIVRIVFASVIIITLGVIAVFGFTIIEPFYTSFGDPPSSLDWGSPGSITLLFSSFGFIGLMLVLVIWLIVAPIREDRRQQIR